MLLVKERYIILFQNYISGLHFQDSIRDVWKVNAEYIVLEKKIFLFPNFLNVILSYVWASGDSFLYLWSSFLRKYLTAKRCWQFLQKSSLKGIWETPLYISDMYLLKPLEPLQQLENLQISAVSLFPSLVFHPKYWGVLSPLCNHCLRRSRNWKTVKKFGLKSLTLAVMLFTSKTTTATIEWWKKLENVKNGEKQELSLKLRRRANVLPLTTFCCF